VWQFFEIEYIHISPHCLALNEVWTEEQVGDEEQQKCRLSSTWKILRSGMRRLIFCCLALLRAQGTLVESDEALCTLQREVKARHAHVSAPDSLKSMAKKLETKLSGCESADLKPWGLAFLCPALALLLCFAWLQLRPKPPESPHLDALEKQADIDHGDLHGDTFVEMLYRRASDDRKDYVALRAWSEARGIERSLTYKELAQGVHAGAASMAQMGVGRGDRVAFFCKGNLDFFVALLSVQARGATPVLLNWRQSKENLQGMIEDSGVKFIVLGALQEARANLLSVLPAVKALILLDGDEPAAKCAVHRWGWSCADAGTVDYNSTEASKLSRDAEALVLFTSGSTSRPKPVLHTYKTLIWTAEKSVYPENTTVTLSFLPNFHVIMTVHNFLCALARGFCISVHAADATEPIGSRMLLKAAKALSPTVIDTVPFIMEEWSALSQQELQPLRTCKWVGSGGAPLSTAVARHLLDAGVPVREYYGQTEAPGIQLATVPGAGADEMKIYMPPWKLAKIVLAGGGEEGELIIQGIGNSAPGNLAKGELVEGSGKMEEGVGHRTGDVFRWTRTASGRKGLVHCMRTDDTTLLSTGEMFNPVPMEKSITAFAHGLEDLRGSQVAVLGKNRPAPILVVELPPGQKINGSLLSKLQPGIDAANSAEVEYARIKPGHVLLLSPQESRAVLPKTAKGNFIRSQSEQVLKDLLDDVESSAKESQASELLSKANAAGFQKVEDFLAAADLSMLKDLGVDSLGVQVQEDDNTRTVNRICDNAKAVIIVGIAMSHWYMVLGVPKLTDTATHVLAAMFQAQTVQESNLSLALYWFHAPMWVFFSTVGISDGMGDGRRRVVTLFNSRAGTLVIVILLYKLTRFIPFTLNYIAYNMTGKAGHVTGSIWFLFAMLYYRAWLRAMQGLRFPRWLQIVTTAAALFQYLFQSDRNDLRAQVPDYLWPLKVMLSTDAAMVPCYFCSLPGRIADETCFTVFPGMCSTLYQQNDPLIYWQTQWNFFGLAYVLGYYYGESAVIWMSDSFKKVLAQISDNPDSRKTRNLRIAVALCSLLASYAPSLILSGYDHCPVEQEFWCFWKQAAVVLALTVFISMLAVSCPFHAKRLGTSTLGIYLMHETYFPYQLTAFSVSVSNILGEKLATCSTGTSVLQLTILLAWAVTVLYVLGPFMQSACIVPATYIRGLVGRKQQNNEKPSAW